MTAIDKQIAALRERGMTEEADALELARSPEGRAEAVRRVRAAMKLVEKAQHDLERATAELASIAGGGVIAWRRVGKAAERAHDLWRWLSYTFLPAHGEHLQLDVYAARASLRSRKERSGA